MQSARLNAARSNRFKLFVDGGMISLYDLETDPGELKDVARERTDEVAALRNCLDAQIAGSPAVADRVELDESHLEQLRALGYQP